MGEDAAVDDEIDACYPASQRRTKKDAGIADILGGAQTPERRRCPPPRNAIGPIVFKARSIDQTRGNRIDPYAVSTELERRGPCVHSKSRLGGGVVTVHETRLGALDRRDMNDRSAVSLLDHLVSDRLTETVNRRYVHFQHQTEVIIRDIGERGYGLDSGIVDQCIDTAE